MSIGRVADQAEEDERGAERIDERKKRAEAQSEVFPDKKHGSTGTALEIAAMSEEIVPEDGELIRWGPG